MVRWHALRGGSGRMGIAPGSTANNLVLALRGVNGGAWRDPGDQMLMARPSAARDASLTASG